MAASLRAFASCIGVNGPFSVLGDFYGFRQRRLPTDPTGVRVEVSLRDQINSLRGRHFNLNVIKVGSPALASLLPAGNSCVPRTRADMVS